MLTIDDEGKFSFQKIEPEIQNASKIKSTLHSSQNQQFFKDRNSQQDYEFFDMIKSHGDNFIRLTEIKVYYEEKTIETNQNSDRY